MHFIFVSTEFYGFLMAVLRYTSNLYLSIYLKHFSSVFTNGFNAMLACQIPACRSDLNITKICNHMNSVHLLRNTALTQQFQVVFRCTKIPRCSYYNAFLEEKAPLGLGFTLTLCIIIDFSDSFTTWSNNSPSVAFSINIGYKDLIKSH